MNNKKFCREIIHIIKGDITDKEILKKHNIDTIVNAAKPTLMGSTQGVDGAIHRAIDRLLQSKDGKGSFNDKIREELDLNEHNSKILPEEVIRCQRGQVVLTNGYGLCDHIIHVVGSEFDGRKKSKIRRGKGGKQEIEKYKKHSSSRVHTLESCYHEIIKIVKKCPNVQNIAIPIISSGEYGFPFELAIKIAIASVGNAVVEWRVHDKEMFELSKKKNIFFVVYDVSKEKELINYNKAKKILKTYNKSFEKDKKVVFQSSIQAHFQYLHEIIKYDHVRGYFSTAKYLRVILLCIRILFFPLLFLKDLLGRNDWQRRRSVVEFLAVAKILLPVLVYFSTKVWDIKCLNTAFEVIILYNLADTITYLLTLIILADIQKPSANIIRSMILLFFNYIEAVVDMSVLYFLHYKSNNVLLREAVAFGSMGDWAERISKNSWIDHAAPYLNSAIHFFFLSMAFGYFAGHMKQRRFRS